MALKDQIRLGMSLPHRSLDPIEISSIRTVAQRAEAIGFEDLWVTDNTLDPLSCMDSLTLLSYVAPLTTTIRLGVSVLVLPAHSPIEAAHRIATLDYLSGGRAIAGLGIGAVRNYAEFQVPMDRRIRRFQEFAELMRALWTESPTSYKGEIFTLEGASMGPKPLQHPCPPIWFGGRHRDALRRAAERADGWMAGGTGDAVMFRDWVTQLRSALEEAHRDPSTFPISKRIFLSVHDREGVAKLEVDHWFNSAYPDSPAARAGAVWGSPAQVRDQLEAFVKAGANHLVLSPVARYEEQLEQLAEVVGFA